MHVGVPVACAVGFGTKNGPAVYISGPLISVSVPFAGFAVSAVSGVPKSDVKAKIAGIT